MKGIALLIVGMLVCAVTSAQSIDKTYKYLKKDFEQDWRMEMIFITINPDNNTLIIKTKGTLKGEYAMVEMKQKHSLQLDGNIEVFFYIKEQLYIYTHYSDKGIGIIMNMATKDSLIMTYDVKIKTNDYNKKIALK